MMEKTLLEPLALAARRKLRAERERECQPYFLPSIHVEKKRPLLWFVSSLTASHIVDICCRYGRHDGGLLIRSGGSAKEVNLVI